MREGGVTAEPLPSDVVLSSGAGAGALVPVTYSPVEGIVGTFDAVDGLEEYGELRADQVVYSVVLTWFSGASGGPCQPADRSEVAPFVLRIIDGAGAHYRGRVEVELDPLEDDAAAFMAAGSRCTAKATFDEWPPPGGLLAGTFGGATRAASNLRVRVKVPDAEAVTLVAGGDPRETEREPEDGPRVEPPLVNRDHWHTAYGIYVCGQFLPPAEIQRDPMGIHSHGDGVIHIHPLVRRAAGARANVGAFLDAVEGEITDGSLEYVGGTWVEGTDRCDGQAAELVVQRPGVRHTNGLASVRLADCAWVTIAFVPRGAAVPPPPTVAALDHLSDVPDGDRAACS